MWQLPCQLLMLAIVGDCFGAPLIQYIQEDPELTPGYFEGDMILEHTRTGIRNKARRWPNGVVYYKFSDGYFADEHREYILLGMRMIEEVTCIRFQEAYTSKRDYILITGESNGCYATVGYINREQKYNLALNEVGKGCFRMGAVLHELIHTLGFYHMQSAWNRDDYVLIKWENVKNLRMEAFYKQKWRNVDDFGEEYDYGSIMHYGPYTFSKNGLPTIVALKPEGEGKMGQRLGMSQSDVNRINLMYECPVVVLNGTSMN